MNNIVFIFLAILTCGSAIGMLITKNLLHAVLMMFLVMFGLAGLFVMAKADVLAVSHLMIYVGGAMILILFGIMLTSKRDILGKNLLKVEENSKLFPLLICVAICFGWFQLINLSKIGFELIPDDQSKLKQVGFLLTTQYSFVFEWVGVFLLIALVGSTFIAKKDE